MKDLKKYNLFGVKYSAVDYETMSKIILEKAKERKSYGVSTFDLKKLLSSHSKTVNEKINNIDLILPASKLINRALNSFYHLKFKEDITSEELLNEILAIAHLNGLNVYLYGGSKQTLTRVCNHLNENFPFVNIVGVYVEKYMDFSDEEGIEDIERINHSDTHIVLVGNESGNPDAWIAEHIGKVNSVLVSAGPAFKTFFENGNGLETPLKITFQFKVKSFLHKQSVSFKKLMNGFSTHLRFHLIFIKYRFFVRRPI